MATPNYFSKLPNIKYATHMNKAGVVDYINIKDYFHLLKVRDDISPTKTLYEPYTVKNGERPEQISYDFYGDEQYYWVILQINDIVDYYSQWTLSQYEFDEYVIKKYGSLSAANETRHYETLEILDLDGNLIMPGRGAPSMERGGRGYNGLKVPGDFEVTYPDRPDSEVYITRKGHVGINAACYPVSHYQYEYDLNEDKSQINILQPKYLSDFLLEYNRYAKKVELMLSEPDVGDFDS